MQATYLVILIAAFLAIAAFVYHVLRRLFAGPR
jgi:hypothetical protein